MKNIVIGGVLALLCSGNIALADSFVHNVDMYGDYNQYLDSTKNVRINYESFESTTYWHPTSAGVWGEVVYKYDLDFAIEAASLYGTIQLFTSTSQGFLDVSPDGINWTTATDGHVTSTPPLPVTDISSILEGSTTAYVRARLYASPSRIYAQFMRTATGVHPGNPGADFRSPNIYQFEASGEPIPEPSTFAALFSMALMGLAIAWRQRKRK